MSVNAETAAGSGGWEAAPGMEERRVGSRSLSTG